MNRREANQITGLTFFLAITICCFCWGQAMAGDPNEPAPADANTAWDPAAHLVAHWTTVSLTAQLYNPGEWDDPPEQERSFRYTRSLWVSGDVDVIDSNGLMGLSTEEVDILALDETGKEILHDTDPRSTSLEHFYLPVRTTKRPTGPNGELVEELRPYNFEVSLPLAPGAGYPLRLSRLEWSMNALIAAGNETVDIPFAVTQDWVPVVPGLEALVEQATVADTSYQYRLKLRYDSRAVSYQIAGFVSPLPGEPLPGRILQEIQIVDAEGRPVGSGSRAVSGGTLSSDQMAYTISGTASGADCGTAATIRYRFAVNPAEVAVRFQLENVPVPGF